MTWVRVKDRLPEFAEPVLGTDGTSVGIVTFYGMYKVSNDFSSCSCDTLDVTHWMPLPESPRLDYRWVDVDDGFPEIGEPLLAYYRGDVYHCWWDDSASMMGDWFDRKNGFIIENVTHWMPLPEPPKD